MKMVVASLLVSLMMFLGATTVQAIEDCPPVPSVQGGRYTCSAAYAVGSICELVCSEGYSPHDPCIPINTCIDIGDDESMWKKIWNYCESTVISCGILRKPSAIEDSQITASSESSATYAARCGRIGDVADGCSPSGWAPASTDPGEWIQADLNRDETIFRVVTQGGDNTGTWVKTYSVSVKSDTGGSGSLRNVVDTTGKTIIFQGNTDATTPVVKKFPKPITARYFRILPITFYEYPALKFDLFTC